MLTEKFFFRKLERVNNMAGKKIAKKTPKARKASGVKKKREASLSAKEIEILRWIQRGKTNEEIGLILGRTKWTVKFHLSNLMKKLDVTTRAQAVSQAIGLGFICAVVEDTAEDKIPLLKVGIVGCGKGGTEIIKLFKDNASVDIRWGADNNTKAPGLKILEGIKVPVAADYKVFLKRSVDVVINLTGSETISEDLRKRMPPTTELMGGVSAKIMWQLFEERRRRVEEKERILREHETLYHLGLVIESIDSLKDAGYAILDYATKLTNAPAGSLALFDEKEEDMVLIASKGFSSDFKKIDRWNIRQGGLTSRILSQDGPLMIPDISEEAKPNPVLMREGVRSLLASPLTVEGRIVGILYVNDFKKRGFRAEDVSLFSLLTIYAGLTIERVKSIEETRMLSITDGLTSLYNQRYMMEQLQSEIMRAARHGQDISVIMFDIDYFKKYNDTYGHLEGNKVLKVISRSLMKGSRATDTVCRFGGEEFCIVMPHVKKKGALKYGQRLVEEIAALKTLGIQVTISGGVASYPADGKDHMEILKAADKRLYDAKKAGRNRIV
jgi:diguanylate cyclase (GGDEF)-like protein